MITCKNHSRYRAKGMPKSNCDVCWGMWLYAEVRRAKETTLPNTMTQEWLLRAVKNHRHAIEKSIRNKI